MKRYLHRGAGRHEVDMPPDVATALKDVDRVPVFPPHVAQVYAWDLAAWPAYDCKRCDYPIPAHMTGDHPDDAIGWLCFERYPICRATVPESDQ